MGRKKKGGGGGGGGGDGWLVTFSDLMTLLLTFFVLLLTMASMDKSMLSRISATDQYLTPIVHGGMGKVQDRIIEVAEMIKDVETVLEKTDRIKELLFPDDILPPEITPGKLEENLRVLAHPEGMVIVLSEGVLFPENSYALNSAGQKLLEALLPFLYYTNADINISGYSDNTESPDGMDKYELSGRRAQSVLAYFLQNQLPARRFSISGYGAERPLEPNTSAANRAVNRRVELLVKTTQWVGRYI